jgi:hypothetical protein
MCWEGVGVGCAVCSHKILIKIKLGCCCCYKDSLWLVHHTNNMGNIKQWWLKIESWWSFSFCLPLLVATFELWANLMRWLWWYWVHVTWANKTKKEIKIVLHTFWFSELSSWVQWPNIRWLSSTHWLHLEWIALSLIPTSPSPICFFESLRVEWFHWLWGLYFCDVVSSQFSSTLIPHSMRVGIYSNVL